MSGPGTTSARGEWETCRFFGCYYSTDWRAGMSAHEQRHELAGDMTDVEFAAQFEDRAS